MNTFILPGHFLIENQFDLEAINTVHSTGLIPARYDAMAPTLGQMESHCQERDIAMNHDPLDPANNDDAIFPPGFISDGEVPVYTPLYNQLTRYTPAIRTARELVIPQYTTRKTLKALDFSSFNDITTLCSYSFSSYKYNNGIEQLLDDDLSLYWQSDSNSSPHWINIQLPSSLLLAYLCIYIDCTADESYTPNEFMIKSGLTAHSYSSSQLIQLAPPPTGWLIIPLQDVQGYINEMQKYTTSHQIGAVLNDSLEREDGGLAPRSSAPLASSGVYQPGSVTQYQNQLLVTSPHIPLLDPLREQHQYHQDHQQHEDSFDQPTMYQHPPIDLTFFDNDHSFRHQPALASQLQPTPLPQAALLPSGSVGYTQQFNPDLPPMANSPSYLHSLSTTTNTNTTISHSAPRGDLGLRQGDRDHHYHNHSPAQPPFNLLAQQHKLPSFHMLIEVLSSYQLGRDCRLRGLKLYSYKPQY